MTGGREVREFVGVVPTVKKYDWGRRESSALTKIYSRNLGLLPEQDEDEPYAELWYGSHISSPSKVLRYYDVRGSNNSLVRESSITLDDVIMHEFKERSCKGKLPFLAKILSISKPLSLQVHPSKGLARELNQKLPEVYPDSNHKPEIAIALSEFEALCGFQATSCIISNIERYPEIYELFGFEETVNASVGGDAETDQELGVQVRRKLFTNMLQNASSADGGRRCIEKLVGRLKNTRDEERSVHDQLILRLNEYYPSDIGIVSPLLLNYHKLSPGDAIFIGAGTIHSYISGECLECMANSDNVIRCGLTSKYKDVNTLLEAVDFQGDCWRVVSTANNKLTSHQHISDYYVECVEEYHVKVVDVNDYYLKKNPSGDDVLELRTSSHSPTMLITISGGCNSKGERLSDSQRNLHQYQIEVNGNKTSIFPGKSFLIDSNMSVRLPRPMGADACHLTCNPSSVCSDDHIVIALIEVPRQGKREPTPSPLTTDQ